MGENRFGNKNHFWHILAPEVIFVQEIRGILPIRIS